MELLFQPAEPLSAQRNPVPFNPAMNECRRVAPPSLRAETSLSVGDDPDLFVRTRRLCLPLSDLCRLCQRPLGVKTIECLAGAERHTFECGSCRHEQVRTVLVAG